MQTFQSIVKRYLQEIQFILGTLNSFNKLIQDEKRRLNNITDVNKTLHFISYSHLVMSDLTGPTENGWQVNYSSGFDRKILISGYPSELDEILKRECAFSIAQSYEKIETFLKDSLALHLYFNKSKADKLNSIFISCNTYADFRLTIRKIKSRNNDELFKLLRKTCPSYREFEIKNNLQHNLYDLFRVISIGRHAIVHQSGVIKKEEVDRFSKFDKELLEFYLLGSKKSGVYILDISIENARRTIKRITEIGFVIFKSLSIHNHKPWNILKK